MWLVVRDPGVHLDLPVGTAADRSITGRWKRTAEPLAAAEAEQLPPAMAAGQTASRLDPLEQQPRRHGLPKREVRDCVGSVAYLSPPPKYAGLFSCSRACYTDGDGDG